MKKNVNQPITGRLNSVDGKIDGIAETDQRPVVIDEVPDIAQLADVYIFQNQMNIVVEKRRGQYFFI